MTRVQHSIGGGGIIIEQMEYLLANIIFMFFHGLFISCSYASDYVTLLNMTWTRDSGVHSIACLWLSDLASSWHHYSLIFFKRRRVSYLPVFQVRWTFTLHNFYVF